MHQSTFLKHMVVQCFSFESLTNEIHVLYNTVVTNDIYTIIT